MSDEYRRSNVQSGAHQAMIGDVAPATSMVEVTRLIDPYMLVEIETDAIVADN